MFYAGDGVSDLSAARETDLLFAKEGCGEFLSPPSLSLSLSPFIFRCFCALGLFDILSHIFHDWRSDLDVFLTFAGCLDLVAWCEKEGVPFRTFRDFRDIHATVKDIVYGRLSVKDAATGRQTWS